MERKIHKDLGKNNCAVKRIRLHLHEDTSLCNGTFYGRGSAVVKLQDRQQKAHLRLEIYKFITNNGIDIKKSYVRPV